MKPEALLQERLIKELKHLKVKALHLSPPSHPGFPDLLCTFVNRFLMVEIKVTDHVGDNKFQSLFTRSQLPWIYNWLNDEQASILVVTEVEDEYYTTIFSSKDQIVKALSMSVKEVFSSSFTNNLESLTEVAECIYLTLAMDFEELNGYLSTEN